MRKRQVVLATSDEIERGVPLFLTQLGEALANETVGVEAIRATAADHAQVLHENGFTVSQVVHGYGDVCQEVTGLAIAWDLAISTAEFRKLNLCLDEAIAGAVTEFSRLRDKSQAATGTERVGFLAHEIRNLLGSAMLSFDLIRTGTVPIAGSTGAILGRSLLRLKALVDRSLTEVRLEAGLADEAVIVAEIMESMEIVATADARVRHVNIEVHRCATLSTVFGDRLLLGSALDNLVQNAIKFTPPSGHVTVTERREEGRVLIDVEDECGGLVQEDVERLFAPFEQRHTNRSGLGPGLAIGRNAVRAMGGEITVRNLPGKGCVFTISLPVVP